MQILYYLENKGKEPIEDDDQESDQNLINL